MKNQLKDALESRIRNQEQYLKIELTDIERQRVLDGVSFAICEVLGVSVTESIDNVLDERPVTKNTPTIKSFDDLVAFLKLHDFYVDSNKNEGWIDWCKEFPERKDGYGFDGVIHFYERTSENEGYISFNCDEHDDHSGQTGDDPIVIFNDEYELFELNALAGRILNLVPQREEVTTQIKVIDANEKINMREG